MPPLLSSSSSESDSEPETNLKINESYAKRLEHNKKREELHRLQEKYGKNVKINAEDDDEEEDSETSESEDEIGELITPKLDAEIWRTIAMIRERRPEVYSKEWKGFTEEDEGPVEKEKKEKPMYLKDYHRKTLLEGDTEKTQETRRITTYEQEQQALKNAFHATLPDSSEDDDLLKPKQRDKATEEKQYQAFLKSTLQDEASQKVLSQLESLASKPVLNLETEDDSEAFLAKYMLNRGWLDPSTEMPELYEDGSEDEERAEEFETQYNFRFEQPGGTEITTHARTLSSARKGDEKRKKERERKKAMKEEQKRKEMEEIARLRNLKRMELEERIQRIEEVAGSSGWTEKDLDGDFDPDEWDKRMQGVFDDEYYNNQDEKKPKFDDIDISDLVGKEDAEDGHRYEDDETVDATVIEKKPTKREKLDKKRKIEEYLDEHLPLNQPKGSFHYREVSPTTFGLTPLEILTSTDSQLNEFVGLKKLAPYRSQDLKQGDQRKYGKKKRLREWRKKVEAEGQDEEIRAMFRPEKPEQKNEPVVVEVPEKKKKKHKSRKHKTTEGEA